MATGGSFDHLRAGLTPPRSFLLPAILLLVSEKPGYRFCLMADLQELGFATVEGPAVSEALGQLEADALVAAWDEPAPAGQARKVYAITADGARVLRAWMGVVKEERDCLNRVLRCYQSSGTPDGVLVPVEGAWQAARGRPRSSVSSIYAPGRRLTAREGAVRPVSILTPRSPAAPADALTRCRFRVVPERSVVVVEARSAVGPMRFGAKGLTGSISLDLRAGEISCDPRPTGELVIAVNELRSISGLYDAELRRRIEAPSFPRVTLALKDCARIGTSDRYRLAAEVTFHGITQLLSGTVGVKLRTARQLVVTGDFAVDVRAFQLPSPTVLMLRIYPDVRVHLGIEAELAD